MGKGLEISMNGDVRPSAGLMVIIVLCLTVLLGIGGTSAYALWEQGSHNSADQSDSAGSAGHAGPKAP
ncbi:Tfp pilus assembly protein PilX [Arthrobacter sp. 1088]|nr:Tfp pilus assembly protein PilX [Arthrobacter sp. 1088]